MVGVGEFQDARELGKAEGRAEDRASLIRRVLEKHGIPVPEETRERITSCTDLDTLAPWFDRSLTATAAGDLFAEDPEEPGPGSAGGS
ncbi:hypothetical protein [Streptomyces sp. NPDC052036]|uniref:hypothetical protein n=1 Tax=Streptomyces sp. NPDC052036 TaxID=3155171 RepID=UPI00343AE4C4